MSIDFNRIKEITTNFSLRNLVYSLIFHMIDTNLNALLQSWINFPKKCPNLSFSKLFIHCPDHFFLISVAFFMHARLDFGEEPEITWD